MFDPKELPELRKAIQERAGADKRLLEELIHEVHTLAGEVRTIRARTTTAVSLVASDGGNNKLQFDPFYVQLVRVVDSYGKKLCLDAVSPTTYTDELSDAQFENGRPKTALGLLMRDLGVEKLSQLSHMIPTSKAMKEDPSAISPSWVMVYRDICEWAVLYESICHRSFATDTLIVRDGLLRSKLFRGELFLHFRKRIEECIARIQKEDRREVYLVGLAKHSKVLVRYNLAIALENTLPAGEARYVRIPRALEAKAYIWEEYARGKETEGGTGEAPKLVAGDMYFVRFGPRSGDPIWAVDILSSQTGAASEVFGYLLSDAIDGFPIPFYPRCLQRAHEYAQIVDFDMDILQDEIFSAVRGLLPKEKCDVLEALRFNTDLSVRRYE